MANSPSVSSLLIALTVGAVLSYIFFAKGSSSSSSSSSSLDNVQVESRQHNRNQRNSYDKAFYLGVTVTFPSPEEKQKFIDIFSPLAKYVKEKEFGTLSYELLNSDKDPKRILISERYKDKEYYLNVHKTSAEFLQFRETFQKMIENGAVVDGHSYIESGIGFM
jgi:quinol monooxygenase YgiN